MSSLTGILEGIAAALEDTLGDDVDQIEPRLVFNPTGLAIDVYPAHPFRNTDTAGFGDTSGEYLFIVRARIPTGDHEASQDALLRLMDDEDDLCLAAALMEDQTLNGLASSVDVAEPSGFRQYVGVDNKTAQLGCQWNVTIVNAKS